MNKRAMIFVGAGVAGALVLGGGGFFAYRALFSPGAADQAHAEGKEEHKEEKAEEKGEAKAGEHGAPAPTVQAAIGPVYAMEPFVVNLADPGRPRYLKLVLQMELDTPQAAAELDVLKPKARDALLMLLSSKTAEEMVTVGGKETLRNEVIRRVNAFLAQGKVTEVYFTEFVVQ